MANYMQNSSKLELDDLSNDDLSHELSYLSGLEGGSRSCSNFGATAKSRQLFQYKSHGNLNPIMEENFEGGNTNREDGQSDDGSALSAKQDGAPDEASDQEEDPWKRVTLDIAQ